MGKKLDETPGIGLKPSAPTVIAQQLSTWPPPIDPQGWDKDRGPKLDNITDAVALRDAPPRLQHRPFAGIAYKGQSSHSMSPIQNRPMRRRQAGTGIDHLKELG